MRTVYLLRHAKSDWNNPNITDFDRPLNERGLRDAKRLNKFLRTGHYSFDKIYCSAALRTTQTFDRALDGLSGDTATEFLDALYHCNGDDILDLLKMQENVSRSVLIINHMPTMQIVYEFLSGKSISNYPTCTLSALEFDGDWRDLDKFRCDTKLYLPPNQLKQKTMLD